MKTLKISAIFLLFSVALFAQKSADLKLNLEKGKVYKFKSSTESSVAQTMGGMQQTTESKNESYVSIKAVDLKPEFVVVEFRIDSTIAKTNTMGKVSVMNSNITGDIKSKEIVDVMNSVMNRMSKNPLYVKLDFSGKAIEIINMKMYSDIVLKGVDSLNIEGPMAPMIKSQITGMVDEKALKTTTLAMFNYLPGKKVTVGEKWEMLTPMTMNGMTFNISSSNKLESVEGNAANIASDMNIQPASAEPMVMGGYKINYSELKGLSKTTMSVNIKNGLFTNSVSKTQMSGNLSIDIPGNPMQVPMDITTESKVTAIE